MGTVALCRLWACTLLQFFHTRVIAIFCLGSMAGTAAAVSDNIETDVSNEKLLNLDLAQLLEVRITSVTKTALKLSDVPAVISIVTADDFEKYHYSSVADSLRTQAGFDVLYDLSFYNVGVRGVNGGLGGQSQVLKAMIDGQDMAFRPTTGAFLGPEFIPTIAIERVEVIRGPMSALYGANAFLGTLNVVPRTAASLSQRPENSQVQLSRSDDWGHTGTEAQMAVWGTPDDFDLFAAVSTQSLDRGGLSLPESSPRYARISAQREITTDQDQEHNASVYLRAARGNENSGELITDFSYQYLDRDGNFQPDSEPLLGAREIYSNTMGRVRYQLALNDRWWLKASSALVRGEPSHDTRQYDPFRVRADYLRQDFRSNQFDSSVDVGYVPREDLNFLLGFDYSFDNEQLASLEIHNKDGSVTTINGNRNADVDNKGVYAQMQWQPLSDLGAVIGVRTDDPSLYKRQNSYRLGLVYTVSNATQIKYLIGHSYKAPPIMRMFGGEHPRLLGPAPNADLQPQLALTHELYFSSLVTPYQQLACTLYETRVDDFVEYDTIADRPQARNRGSTTAKGFELEWRWSPWPAMESIVSLAHVTTQLSSDLAVGIEVSDQSRLYPANSASWRLAYSGAHWRSFLIGYYLGERAADKSNLAWLPSGEQQEYFLPAYRLLDVGIETLALHWLNRSETRVSLALKNALDTHYVEPGFSGIDVPGLRRRIELSLQQGF